MARLPIPGADDGSWGDILNAYLGIAHASDGTLNSGIVGTSQLQDNAVTNAKLDIPTQTAIAAVASKYVKPAGGIPGSDLSSGVQTSLGKADSALQAAPVASVFGRTGTVTAQSGDYTAAQVGAIATSAEGAANGVATLDSGSHLASSQLPSSVVNATQLFANVKDYGAKGDGTTDDTTAIANAIAAVQPSQIVTIGTTGTVFFPAGVYITSPLPALSEQVSLVGIGPGTTIKLKASSSSSANLITNYQGGSASSQMINVSNMILDGNKSNQSAGAYQSGIVMNNPAPSGSYGYTDGRHTFHGLTIQNFTGDGLVMVANSGATFVNNVSSWFNDGFGFNVHEDAYFSNCDAGSTGLDGFLIQGGSNRFTGCKSWFSGRALVNSRGANSGSQPTVNAPTANPWCGGNFTVPLVFSLANGFGNGWHWTNINGTSKGTNFSGGTYTSCGAQDNARAGFYLDDCGRQTLSGIEADSNNNNGTSDGTSGGTPVGSFAGVEIANSSSNNIVQGISWNRSANVNQQAAALRLDSSSSRNRSELAFFGKLNGATNNMPALTSDSVMAGNYIKFASEGGYNAASFASSYTPDPFISSVIALTLTGNITLNNPALSGTNGGAGIYYPPGMTLSFLLTQDSTGSRTVTWGNNYTLSASWLPAPQANAVTVIKFTYNGSSWVADGGQNGVIAATGFAPAGLTGVTAASRYVGATASGAPATGTFAIGDYSIDQTGNVWICTAAGTPGTWAGVSTGAINFAAITTNRAARVESGAYVVSGGSNSTGTSTGPWALGLVYFAPFDIPVTQTFTGLATSISSQATGGTSPLIHIGLYADDGTGARPTGSPLTSTEVTLDPTTTSGDRYVAWGAPQSLNVNRVWAAWMITSGSALGGQPTMVTLNPVQNIGLDVLTASSHRGWTMSAATNASTLPAVSGIFRNGGSWPIMGMKAQ